MMCAGGKFDASKWRPPPAYRSRSCVVYTCKYLLRYEPQDLSTVGVQVLAGVQAGVSVLHPV